VSADEPDGADADQQEVLRFLADPRTHGMEHDAVERIETHGAIVLLAADDAYKIKKAVRFSYMDFSTRAQRRRACEREIEINQPHAPDIYLGIVAITRETDGRLALGGDGEPVEWAVHMRRFPPEMLMSAVADRGALTPQMAKDSADAVIAHHLSAPRAGPDDAVSRLERVVDELGDALGAAGMPFAPEDVASLLHGCRQRLSATGDLLRRRAAAGHVRRCHGDLHLGNMVLWQGRPTLFDAIEFDEEMATIDTLYDLAFLLMDLDQRGRRDAANIVLNRYLWRSREPLDLEGLAALPLLLALRAAIRAMVTAQRAAQGSCDEPSAKARAQSYLRAALSYLNPQPPRLVAVGGLSGTGKSTLAAAIAPLIGPAPGAVHLRSDLERKAMAGVEETERLPADSYTPASSRDVYRRMTDKARVVLAAGHSVVTDAVFLEAAEREAMAALARKQGVRFDALWLTAPAETLVQRVDARCGDASDATSEVVQRQLVLAAATTGPDWRVLDAGGPREALLASARDVLGA
jgi:aminoglycoside phosphotransferase family enzyme/predicted kinase